MSDLILPDTQKPEMSEEEKNEREQVKRYESAMMQMFSREMIGLKSFPELWELMIKGQFITPTGVKPMIPFKLYELMCILESYKPKNILELGSGYTSCVFAKYAAKTGAHYISIEESEAYKQETMRRVAATGSFANIVICPVEKTADYCRYTNIPESDYDFVYVDGPSNGGDEETHGLARTNGTEYGNKGAETIVYDYSIPSVKSFDAPNYRITLGYPFMTENHCYHTIFNKLHHWWI